MKYSFFESHFGQDFGSPTSREVYKLIDSSTSFTLAGMPGVGVTIFLRYLASADHADFIYIDSYSLASLSQHEFFQTLLFELGSKVTSANTQELIGLCKEKLQELASTKERVVLIFNRFDQLKNAFDVSFFNNIHNLRSVDPTRIVIITTSNRPLYEVAPDAIKGGHLGLFTKTVYLKPYSQDDVKAMVKAFTANNLIADEMAVNEAIGRCGGHYQLLQLLLKSARVSNPLQDHFIKLQLKELYNFVSFKQRKILEKIAFGKNVDEVDEYLLDIGLVIKDEERYRLFNPLLEEYIKTAAPLKLPSKEAKLFKLLRRNLGKLVTKEEIFNTLWPEDTDEYDNASEWALNSLIYRMKKNPAFIASGYTIENLKKEGYILVKD